ncbi:AMP-binding protein [Musicola keenii]|uniref:AMP-binding protein n=1 Tax=Musicola keenii TaxID=2884250 RepID=UPI001CE2AFD3|nr:AMP-binding protein [Musicola keenii]
MCLIASWQPLITLFARFEGTSAIAYHHIDGCLTYRQLYLGALALAEQLDIATAGRTPRPPVLLYGHKNRVYLIAYWACLLTGHPIVPMETDNADARLRTIADSIQAELLLNLTDETAPDCGIPVIPVTMALCEQAAPSLNERCRRMGMDFGHDNIISGTAYIMFSSGTTGAPKGIRIGYPNLAHFVRWIEGRFPSPGAVSGNIRYCFDVSLYELWLAWLHLEPISTLDYRDIINTRKMIARHAEAGVQTWVSTPSLVRNYLQDRQFRQENLPQLNTFIFCGEVLPKEMVDALWRAFPGCRIVNTYGPTECTVAVTACDITPEMMSDPAPLPIGRARPGVGIHIDTTAAQNGRGEILLCGAAVGEGYLNAAASQQARFFTTHNGVRGYRTGDLGSLRDGLLYFHGRKDDELKIQGYRISPGEIEHLLRQHPQVQDVIVSPWLRQGIPQALQAFVLSDQVDICPALAAYLQRHVPAYMIPRFWYPIDDPTLNLNSKLDRRQIAEQTPNRGKRYVFVGS